VCSISDFGLIEGYYDGGAAAAMGDATEDTEVMRLARIVLLGQENKLETARRGTVVCVREEFATLPGQCLGNVGKSK